MVGGFWQWFNEINEDGFIEEKLKTLSHSHTKTSYNETKIIIKRVTYDLIKLTLNGQI